MMRTWSHGQKTYTAQPTVTHRKAKLAEYSVSDVKAFCVKTGSTSGVCRHWHDRCQKNRGMSAAMHVSVYLG